MEERIRRRRAGDGVAEDRTIGKDVGLIKRLRTELSAESTLIEFRVKAGDFSRQPVLTIPRLAALILRGHQMSQQNAVNRVFRELKQLDQLPTGSAYCQARSKLKPELFIHLNNVTVEEFTRLSEADGSLQRWHGHRIVGADGTWLNLPDTKALREAFTVSRNQCEKAGERVQGLGMLLYDLLHDVAVAAHIGPVAGEPEVLIKELWRGTREGDLIVLDRGYLGYALIAYAVQHRRELIIRCRMSHTFKEIEQFRESDETESFVVLNCTINARAFVEEQHLPETVRVRLLKFQLPSGETEILLTTLCDVEKYAAEDIYEAYGFRWRQETYYDRIKNIFELERFSGLSVHTVEQDFYGVVFLATLESTLAASAQAALDEEAREKDLKLKPQVNRAVSYVTLLDHTVYLLANPDIPLESVVTQLHRLLQTNPKRHPPSRRFERPNRSTSRTLNNVRYRKRVTA